MTQQKCRVSLWGREPTRSDWRRDFLRLCVGDPAERPSEHENGYKQVPHSRSLPCETAKVKGHLFSSSLVILMRAYFCKPNASRKCLKGQWGQDDL
jgi:hypothetical protein